MAEVKVTILAKKGDNKAFKASDENWYNLNDNVVETLSKLSKGDEIVITYEKKGVSRYVSKIVKAGEAVESKGEVSSSDKVICPGCGKEKKNDSFKVCFVCNKKGIKAPQKTEEKKEVVEEKIKPNPNYYNNPEKTAQIQRGNALNAAASVAASQQFNDMDTAAQFTLELATRLLEWLKAE